MIEIIFFKSDFDLKIRLVFFILSNSRLSLINNAKLK